MKNQILAVIAGCALLAGCSPRERSIEYTNLPTPVQTTIQTQGGSAETVDIEQESLDGRTVYRVEFKEQAGPDREGAIWVAEDGSIVKDTRAEGTPIREGAGAEQDY
jgi:hypothetical protein